MADDKRELEYYDDFGDDDEFEIEVDNTPADFKGGWFAVKITRAPITQTVYDGSATKYLTTRVGFSIVDDDSFEGIGANCFIPLTGKSIQAAKKRKAFLNALADADTGDRPVLKGEVVTTTEGTRIPQLADVIDSRLGVYLVVDGKYLNVKDELFCPYSEVEAMKMKMEDMDDF